MRAKKKDFLMSAPKQAEFSRRRAMLWPIHGFEMKKFVPMAIIMICILFNYTVVRSLKDAMMVTGEGSGAEVINFIKSWVVLPSSVLFVILFAKLSNVLSKQALYYTCLIPFILFFGVFGYVIYPAKDMLHPSPETIAHLQQTIPWLKWAFPIYGLWTYSLFYVLAELWGNIGTNLLFWQFANQITQTEQAKRFYPLIACVGNTALIFAGMALQSTMKMDKIPGVDSFGQGLQILTLLVLGTGTLIGITYWWMNKYLLNDPRYYAEAKEHKKGKEKKPKLSIWESVKYLGTSKYLGYITLLVLGYGMTINLVEVTWKSQIKLAYPTSELYTHFMGGLYTWLGALTIILLYTTKGVVRRFGWFTGAIATPVMILITAVLFFAFVIFQDSLGHLIAFLGTTPLMAAVYIGAAQNALSKGTKYALFDPTREMTYIPLDQEMKMKGKAAIDVVGGRFGKSGGGWIQVGLLSALGSAGTQMAIAPYLAVMAIFIVFAWMWAVKKLDVEYTSVLKKKEEEDSLSDMKAAKA
jgi:AAA family ATP:ADP antiporter